jgi:hypothetical protein
MVSVVDPCSAALVSRWPLAAQLFRVQHRTRAEALTISYLALWSRVTNAPSDIIKLAIEEYCEATSTCLQYYRASICVAVDCVEGNVALLKRCEITRRLCRKQLKYCIKYHGQSATDLLHLKNRLCLVLSSMRPGGMRLFVVHESRRCSYPHLSYQAIWTLMKEKDGSLTGAINPAGNCQTPLPSLIYLDLPVDLPKWCQFSEYLHCTRHYHKNKKQWHHPLTPPRPWSK